MSRVRQCKTSKSGAHVRDCANEPTPHLALGGGLTGSSNSVEAKTETQACFIATLIYVLQCIGNTVRHIGRIYFESLHC